MSVFVSIQRSYGVGNVADAGFKKMMLVSCRMMYVETLFDVTR